MKISVRNLEPTKVKLTVTVDPEEFNPYLDEALQGNRKAGHVPGFRKGHVPGKIIDQRIGFGAVAGEAVNNGVPELYSKALETKKIHPMAQPEIDVQDVPESAKDETKLKFVATVERRPDIELPALERHGDRWSPRPRSPMRNSTTVWSPGAAFRHPRERRPSGRQG